MLGSVARSRMELRLPGIVLPPEGYNPATRVKFIGAPIKRLEDPRLLVGGGRYVDDLARPGMVHAVIVRSPHAHARVVHVDARRALAQKGVLACVTGADLGGVPPIPIRQGAKPAHAAYLQPPLAGDRVRYVGEPVAVVVATDRASAVDARELVGSSTT